MRRPRVSWMTRADDIILEFLLNEGSKELAATPGMIELNIDYGRTHISNRLKQLRDADLVEYFDEERGAYKITDHGRAYLAGELDADDLEDVGEE